MAFLEVAGGVVLGAALAQGAAWLTRREERAYAKRERVAERKREAAQVLDDALREAKWRMPALTGAPNELKAVVSAHDAWQDGEFRAGGLLRGEEIYERYRSAGWALLVTWLEVQRGGGADVWVVGRAIDDARRAVHAFLLDEPMPPRTFPIREDATRLAPAKPTGTDFSQLHQWLEQHPEP
jgi:hypothetical protein